MISASHNPYRDNGIKIFSPDGKKIGDEIEKAIERAVVHESSPDDVIGGELDDSTAVTFRDAVMADIQQEILRVIQARCEQGTLTSTQTGFLQ